jgi:hypothetical protein
MMTIAHETLNGLAFIEFYQFHSGSTNLLWVYAGGVEQPGLVARRKAELALWNGTPACGSLPTESNI